MATERSELAEEHGQGKDLEGQREVQLRSEAQGSQGLHLSVECSLSV